MPVLFWAGRHLYETQQDRGDDRQHRQVQIGRQEDVVGDQRVRALHHLRPDDRRQHAARQHQRNGSRPGVGIGDLGGREPQVLGDAEAQPGRDRAQAVDDEIAGVDAQCEGQAAHHHDAATQPEPAAPAQPGEGVAGDHRGAHDRDHLDRHRQRVQRGAGQFVADQGGHHRLARHHGVHQRLTGEQQPDILVHALGRLPLAKNGSSLPLSEQEVLRWPGAP